MDKRRGEACCSEEAKSQVVNNLCSDSIRRPGEKRGSGSGLGNLRGNSAAGTCKEGALRK